MTEPEIMIVRRAFPEAQRLLAGVPSGFLGPRQLVGWHDTTAHPEMGAVALARRGSDLETYIGEVLRVTSEFGSAFVYVIGGNADLLTDLSLARRAFLAVGPLAEETLPCVLETLA